MARINIEDSLFRDLRFLKLVGKTGDHFKAVGIVTMGFILAQQNWLKFRGIPKEKFPEELMSLVDVGLAVVRENLVYIHGSEEQFAWLDRNSKAGKSKSKLKTSNLKKGKKKPEPTPNLGRTYSEPNGSSYSSSYSSSFSNSGSSSKIFSENSKKVIEKYFESWKQKYSAQATLAPKDFKMLKSLFENHGEKKACELIEAYFAMNDSWFLTRRHDVGSLVANLQKVGHFMQTGVNPSRVELNKLETQSSMISAIKKLEMEISEDEKNKTATHATSDDHEQTLG